MRLLLASAEKPSNLIGSLLKRGFAVEYFPVDALIDFLKGPSGSVSAADAVMCYAPNTEAPQGFHLYGGTPYGTAIKLAEDIRGLPDSCATSDGRKWKALPYILLTYDIFRASPIPDDRLQRLDITTVSYDFDPDDHAFDLVRKTVSEYLQNLLREMEDLGFLVAYDHGRFKVGPALNPKQGIEGYYYYGPGDRRKAPNKLFTVDRDLYGIKYEVEQFESLINALSTSEPDLQRFFEEHPHFLVGSSMAEPIPHPRFTDNKGNVLVPDFVLRPVVAQQRHTKWEILDLKLPTEKLIAGPARHRGFSSAVVKAITQLKNYGDYFQNPSNSETVRRVLGHPLRYPRLAVLIGRLPSEGQLEELEKAQSREPYVRVVTYDEILETQVTLIK